MTSRLIGRSDRRFKRPPVRQATLKRERLMCVPKDNLATLADIEPIQRLPEGECIAVEIDPPDLRLAIYVINSGILRIKEQSQFKAPDPHDRKAMRYGREMLDDLLLKYRVASKRVKKGA